MKNSCLFLIFAFLDCTAYKTNRVIVKKNKTKQALIYYLELKMWDKKKRTFIFVNLQNGPKDDPVNPSASH